jgi:hypothetical protein
MWTYGVALEGINGEIARRAVAALLVIEERALAALRSRGKKLGRYHPPDKLLAFLEAL